MGGGGLLSTYIFCCGKKILQKNSFLAQYCSQTYDTFSNLCVQCTYMKIHHANNKILDIFHTREFTKKVLEMSSKLFVTLYSLSIYPSPHSWDYISRALFGNSPVVELWIESNTLVKSAKFIFNNICLKYRGIHKKASGDVVSMFVCRSRDSEFPCSCTYCRNL